MKIDFLQLRHTYAASEGLGAPYLPSALTNVAARVKAVGGKVRILDGNFPNCPPVEAPYLGINVVGAPYIPEVIELQKKLPRDVQLILGGQVIDGLTAAERDRLFGSNVWYGETGLQQAVGRALPHKETVDTVAVYEGISDEHMREYLSPSREISFYLSQGCAYRCTFCAADKGMQEKYRSMEAVEKDLAYLMDRAIRLEHSSLSMYLSNLDLFQTPEQLEKFAGVVNRLQSQRPGFTTRLRGLSTAHMLLKAQRERPDCLAAMKEAGLWTVGIGVDGVSAETWRATRKQHNNGGACMNALGLLSREGILPEALMVVGHPSDTPETLQKAVAFLQATPQERTTLTPRPYVAKSCIPGNDGWQAKEFQAQREALMADPRAFQALDYAAYPSRLTHPDAAQRAAIRVAFDVMCALPGCTTTPIEPIECGMNEAEMARVRALNVGRYDR